MLSDPSRRDFKFSTLNFNEMSELHLQLIDLALSVNFNGDALPSFALHCLIILLDFVDRLSIYFEQDVSNLHFAQPSWRLSIY